MIEYTKQVMNNAIAHHPPTDAQPVPKQQPPPASFPPVYILSMTSYGMEYAFGQFGSAVLAVLPPSSCAPPHLQSM